MRAHDRARDLVPDEVWAEALSLLQARLGSGAGVVEVGIGSGSYGGRLATRGIQVIGVDINETMLQSARGRWPDLNARLVQADATELPIRAGEVDAVLIAQVLHVVPNWHHVLDETMRILRGGGLLVLSGGGGVGRPGVGQYFRSVLGDVPQLPGASSQHEICDAVLRLGGKQLDPIRIETEAPQSLREFIDRLENNPFAWHPDVDQQQLAIAAEQTRADVVKRGLDLDKPLSTPVGVGFDLFHVPHH